jgi:hypothetical protein
MSIKLSWAEQTLVAAAAKAAKPSNRIVLDIMVLVL